MAEAPFGDLAAANAAAAAWCAEVNGAVPAKTHASFDDPDLVSRAGLVPVMALAQRCGRADLAGGHVTIASPAGVNPYLKIPCWSRAWPPGRTTS